MAARCSASTKAGSPCRNPALEGEATCFFHLPPDDPRRQAGSTLGGRRRSNRERARRQFADQLDVTQVRALVGHALVQVLAGKVQPNVGSAVAALSRAYATLAEVGELEVRLAALEAAMVERDERERREGRRWAA